MSKNRLPTSLLEAVRYFADPDICVQFVANLRWSDGPECPVCGSKEYSYLSTRRLWKCKNKECRKQYSVKLGTIFEDSPIPLDKWLCSIWLIANSKNGISSHELGRAVGLTQKSAWFVLHRIRLAMRTGSFQRFDGEVEADEAFVGGLSKHMHKADRDRRITARGGNNKSMVVGALQRGTDEQPSQVSAEVQLDSQWNSPQGFVRQTVEPGADLYTDAATMYQQLRGEYKHQSVDHSRAEYSRGQVTTNGIENFWTLLKRGLAGTYVAVEPDHLFRYVDERIFTFNLRHLTDLERFQTVLGRVAGRRLTWAELVA